MIIQNILISLIQTSIAIGQSIHVITYAGDGIAGSTDGSLSSARFDTPTSLGLARNGDLLVSESNNNIQRIRRITTSGIVSTIAGGTISGRVDGQGTNSRLNTPRSMISDINNNIFFTEQNNHCIRVINATGYVSTFAGNGTAGNRDGPASSAQLNGPIGIAMVPDGRLFVTEHNGHRIRMVNITNVSAFVGTGAAAINDGIGTLAGLNNPFDIVYHPDGNLYVSEYSSSRIRRVTLQGAVTLLAGNASNVGAIDGQGSIARFNRTTDMKVLADRGILVCDRYNNRLRRVETTGIVSTFAGSTSGFRDGILSTALFNRPDSIIQDLEGSIYVAEPQNNRIRKIIFCPANTTFDTVRRLCVLQSCGVGLQLNVTSNSCDICPQGTFKNTTGNGTCTVCALGTQFTANRTSCNTCLSGTYRPNSNILTCTPCPSGSSCSGSSFSCLPGFELGVGANTCQMCADGNVKASSGNTVCNICAEGFQPNTNRTQCLGCLPGYQFNSLSNTCNLCDSGSFKTSFGMGSCSICPIGFQSSTNRTQCVECSGNTYRSNTDMRTCFDCPLNANCSSIAFTCLPGFTENGGKCETCPAGTVKTVYGNQQCVACGSGFQPNADSSRCVSCPQNQFKPTNDASLCTSCPVGASCNTTSFLCLPGFELSSQGICTFCQPGYFKASSGNSDSCVRCSIGQESDSSRTICEDCNPGFFKSSTLFPDCIKCPKDATCTKTQFVCNSGYEMTKDKLSCIKSTSNVNEVAEEISEASNANISQFLENPLTLTIIGAVGVAFVSILITIVIVRKRASSERHRRQEDISKWVNNI